jgi:hypothetical protein
VDAWILKVLERNVLTERVSNLRNALRTLIEEIESGIPDPETDDPKHRDTTHHREQPVGIHG